MQIAPMTANVQREIEANAGVHSGFRRGVDFSKYLAEERTPPPIPVLAADPDDQPDIDEMAGQIYGNAYDALNHVIQVDRWRQNVQAETDAFARKLGGLLRGIGIDTNDDITLLIANDGSIRVANGRWDRQEIETHFFLHPELAEEYRLISGNNDLIAQSKIHQEYSHRWNTARSESERQQLASYFSGLLEQAEDLSGRMTLSKDSLIPASMAYAEGILKS